MSQHPLNLGVRFALEIVALVAVGMWGYQKPDGTMRYLLMIALPLLLAGLWGTFRVPNDPGVPPVQVPGVVRLVLELGFFGAATWAFLDVEYQRAGVLLALAVLIHYVVSYDRILWLLKQ